MDTQEQQNTKASSFAHIMVQTSAYGVVIPIIYGTNKITGNIIYYPPSDFIYRSKLPDESKGGKHVIQPVAVSAFNYYSCFMIGICEGLIDGVNSVWNGKTRTDCAALGLSLYTGDDGQAEWTYLTSNHSSEALNYNGTAYVAVSAFNLGTDPNMQNFSYEVKGKCVVDWPTIPDGNPSSILMDFLSSNRYGVGWDGYSKIGDLSQYDVYCNACGFWISPALKEQRPAKDWIGEWLVATNSNVIWSVASEGGGLSLKIVPYGDMVVSGNGYDYYPDTSPVYNLNSNDFLVNSPGDNPIEVSRISIADTYNSCPVQYKDRYLSYNDNTVIDDDFADVESNGERRKDVTTLNCITRLEHALVISRIIAQRSCYIRNTYRFMLGWKYILLEPMDLVTITDSLLGLDHKIVRIKSIEEDGTLGLTIEAEEWPSGAGTGVGYPTGTGDPGGGQPSRDEDPGSVTTSLIFDVPVLYRDARTSHEIMIGSTGLSALWGGCEVHLSYDGTTYNKVSTISKAAKIGVSTAALAPSSVIEDVTHTLSVDLTSSSGALVTSTHDAMEALSTLCWIDGELIAYQDATLTASYCYDLTTLRRGGYGTDATVVHVSASAFAYVDDAFVRFVIPASKIGSTLYIKLVSFNIYGGGKHDISGITPITFVPLAQYPPAPTDVSFTATLAGGGGDDGIIYNGGVPQLLQKYDFNLSWNFPVTADEPDHFEVVCYTGADPSVIANQIFQVVTSPSGARGFATQVRPSADISGINAAVRAVYV